MDYLRGSLYACNGVHYQKRDNVEDYIDDYLKKSAYLRTYSNNFHAIPDENIWPDGNFETVLPLIRKRGVGRPRLSRRRGSNEPKKVQRSVGFRCRICKEVGHNSRTCKNKSHPEVGSSSTPGGPDSTHPEHSSTHIGNATTTGLGGSSTTAASQLISGTITRVEMSTSQPNLVDIDYDSNNPLNTQSQAPSCDINLVDIYDIECESGRQTSQANMRSTKRSSSGGPKQTSEAWNHFKRVIINGEVKVICHHCAPDFNGISRNTLKNEVIKLYEVEKSRTMMMLDENTSRTAFITDMWISNQKKGYMVVTAHFIDNT
ncbi:hypothetical protein Dsin_001794 [Dipteronia sinensis]|uniref:Uncharacterized protein n=1 Tax=Dipteronia sinensis TaxID=43782 RepID=A0AAE0EIP0_9ROSI|nr:hypothetical protein Dsin_001794 [Dipteronia sinensis]